MAEKSLRKNYCGMLPSVEDLHDLVRSGKKPREWCIHEAKKKGFFIFIRKHFSVFTHPHSPPLRHAQRTARSSQGLIIIRVQVGKKFELDGKAPRARCCDLVMSRGEKRCRWVLFNVAQREQRESGFLTLGHHASSCLEVAMLRVR